MITLRLTLIPDPWTIRFASFPSRVDDFVASFDARPAFSVTGTKVVNDITNHRAYVYVAAPDNVTPATYAGLLRQWPCCGVLLTDLRVGNAAQDTDASLRDDPNGGGPFSEFIHQLMEALGIGAGVLVLIAVVILLLALKPWTWRTAR